MGRLTNVSRDTARREKYAALMRRLCALRLPDGRQLTELPSCPYPAQLRRLVAGENVIVQGWEVGIADNGTYAMDASGRLIPTRGISDS